MTFKAIPGLLYNGLPVGYDDSGAVVTPPAPTPTPTPQPPIYPAYINPQPQRSVILTKMPWTPATRIYSKVKLNDSNIWIIPFTTSGFTSGSFSAGEWIDQPTFRIFGIYRNRDGAQMMKPLTAQTPSVNFIATVPPPRTAFIQLDQHEEYTIAIYNQVTALGAGQMFCELQFKP